MSIAWGHINIVRHAVLYCHGAVDFGHILHLIELGAVDSNHCQYELNDYRRYSRLSTKGRLRFYRGGTTSREAFGI